MNLRTAQHLRDAGALTLGVAVGGVVVWFRDHQAHHLWVAGVLALVGFVFRYLGRRRDQHLY